MDPRFSKNGALPVNVGPVNAYPRDRFGNVIRIGQNVIYQPEIDVVYRVIDIRPVLDPRSPTGTVEVVLEARAGLRVIANQPIGRFLAVGAPPDADESEAEAPPAVTEN